MFWGRSFPVQIETASRKSKQNQQGCRFVPKQHRKQTATDGTKLDLNHQGLAAKKRAKSTLTKETLRYPKPLIIGCGLVFFQQALGGALCSF